MFCAIDVSGDQKSKNYKYLALVACTEEFLHSMIRDAGLNAVIKSSIDKQVMRKTIISSLREDARKCFVLCVKIEKNAILDKIKKSRFMQRYSRTRNTQHVIRIYNRNVMELIRNPLDEFLARHGRALAEIKVESDGDCKGLLSDNGIRWTKKSHTHMIADATAWANNHDSEPRGAVRMDIVEPLTKSLIKELKARSKGHGQRRPRLRGT